MKWLWKTKSGIGTILIVLGIIAIAVDNIMWQMLLTKNGLDILLELGGMVLTAVGVALYIFAFMDFIDESGGIKKVYGRACRIFRSTCGYRENQQTIVHLHKPRLFIVATLAVCLLAGLSYIAIGGYGYYGYNVTETTMLMVSVGFLLGWCVTVGIWLDIRDYRVCNKKLNDFFKYFGFVPRTILDRPGIFWFVSVPCNEEVDPVDQLYVEQCLTELASSFLDACGEEDKILVEMRKTERGSDENKEEKIKSLEGKYAKNRPFVVRNKRSLRVAEAAAISLGFDTREKAKDYVVEEAV